MLLSICNIETIQHILHVISLWWLCITVVWPRGSKKLPTIAPSDDWNAIWHYFTLLRLCLALLFFISIDLNLGWSTIESQVIKSVYNMEFYFFPKGHSKQTSNFPFIDNLKKPACVSKWDRLVPPTLRYVNNLISVFNTKKEREYL